MSVPVKCTIDHCHYATRIWSSLLPVSDSVMVTALATALMIFSDGIMGARSNSDTVSTVAVKIYEIGKDKDSWRLKYQK